MNNNWNKVNEGEELSTLAKIVVATVGKSRESGKMLRQLEEYITSLVQQSKEEERGRHYNFPKWFTEERKSEFFDMWACFNRNASDYFLDCPYVKLNHKECQGTELLGSKKLEGIYFHKSSNIGWIFDGKEIHHVYNASLSNTPKT